MSLLKNYAAINCTGGFVKEVAQARGVERATNPSARPASRPDTSRISHRKDTEEGETRNNNEIRESRVTE